MTRLLSCTVAALSLGLILLSTTVVSAQDTPPAEPGQGRQGRSGGRGFGGGFGGAGGFTGGGGGDTLTLLVNEKIQKELELLDEQKEELKKLVESQRAQGLGLDFAGFRDLSPEERQKKMAEMGEKMQARVKEVRGKVDEILLPHQVERLREISVQLRGTGALADAEVADKLKLSDEQKEQIKKIRDEAQGGRRGGFRMSEEERAKAEEARKATSAKILEVLSKEQQDAFAKMQGDKFEIDRSELFRGFGGRTGGNRGGNNSGSNPSNQD